MYHEFRIIILLLIIGAKKGDGRVEVPESCVCIGGFLQPLPFVQKQFALIHEFSDGFADRLLLCTPKPKLLKECELDVWVSNLEKSGLMSMKEPYSPIEEWHSGSASFYTFDAGGMEVYKQFADEIVELMNKKWDSPLECADIGNVSKDKRTMIRSVACSSR